MEMRFRCCECGKEIGVPINEEELKDEDLFKSDTSIIDKALPYLKENKWDFILGRCYCTDHITIGMKELKDHMDNNKEKAA